MTNNRQVFDAMEKDAILCRVRSYVITHPKKEGYATITLSYPKDAAGRLKAYCIDRFGVEYIAQSGYAGGYGYDKATTAMSGFIIDGKTLTNHCGTDKTSESLLKSYAKAETKEAKEKVIAKAKKIGYKFTNWSSLQGYCPTGQAGYQSCYKESGPDYLRVLGYRVISVI